MPRSGAAVLGAARAQEKLLGNHVSSPAGWCTEQQTRRLALLIQMAAAGDFEHPSAAASYLTARRRWHVHYIVLSVAKEQLQATTATTKHGLDVISPPN